MRIYGVSRVKGVVNNNIRGTSPSLQVVYRAEVQRRQGMAEI